MALITVKCQVNSSAYQAHLHVMFSEIICISCYLPILGGQIHCRLIVFLYLKVRLKKIPKAV